MNIRAWQQDNGLLKAARELRDGNDTFQRIFQLACDESPANQPTCINTAESEHSRRLGYIEGYHYCLRVLEATWTKPIRIKEIEAKFESPKE